MAINMEIYEAESWVRIEAIEYLEAHSQRTTAVAVVCRVFSYMVGEPIAALHYY